MTPTANTPASSARTPSAIRRSADRRVLPAAGTSGRALRARIEPMTVRPLRDDRYVVETDSGTYVVDLVGHSCTCPDHAIRDARCKHLRRVAIEVTDGLVPPPGQREGACAVCGGGVFVPMFERGPHLCAAHDFEPGELVRDRESGSSLVVVENTGERADERATESGRTVADYDSNAEYGRHEPVIEVVYTESLRSKMTPGPEKRYGFPASRLVRTDRDADRGRRLLDRLGASEAAVGSAETPA